MFQKKSLILYDYIFFSIIIKKGNAIYLKLFKFAKI